MSIIEHISNERPTDGELAAFCELIGGELPEDYRAFLKSENGGRPKPHFFEFQTNAGGKEGSEIHYFFGLHSGRIGNLRQKVKIFQSRVPPGYLPMATD